MAFIYKRKQKGRVYYYIRETARVNGKVKVVFQEYLGTIENILKLKKASENDSKPTRIKSFDFGSVWMFNEIDRDIDIAGIVDEVIPRGKNEKGPTLGEYMFYTMLNRCIEPQSKNKLKEWYKKTAIQAIRPVELSQLTSSRYWDKWDRVTEKQLEEISSRFLSKLFEWSGKSPECFLFDTTNQFTFFSEKNGSSIAKRGKNKVGRHHLRQIGFALVLDSEQGLPTYFKTYEGNRHDSNVFNEIIGDVINQMRQRGGSKRKLTVVFDKGMNSESNISYIDQDLHLNFVTSYSPYYCEKLINKNLSDYRILGVENNESNDDAILGYRSEMDLWGEKRAVLVSYNPSSARKQSFKFDEKLSALRTLLLTFRGKVNAGKKHWCKQEDILKRYQAECARLHISPKYYTLSFKENNGLEMSFRQNVYELKKARKRFGKNVIVTDRMEWSAEEIYRAYNDRTGIEDQFRRMKSPFQVSISPAYHWTDQKLRIFYFTCVVALSYLRILELKLARVGVKMTAEKANEAMKSFHSSLIWNKGKKKPERMIDVPTNEQNVVLNALGYVFKDGCVLQK